MLAQLVKESMFLSSSSSCSFDFCVQNQKQSKKKKKKRPQTIMDECLLLCGCVHNTQYIDKWASYGDLPLSTAQLQSDSELNY